MKALTVLLLCCLVLSGCKAADRNSRQSPVQLSPAEIRGESAVTAWELPCDPAGLYDSGGYPAILYSREDGGLLAEYGGDGSLRGVAETGPASRIRVQSIHGGVCLYEENRLTFLESPLREIRRTTLPAETDAAPVVSQDGRRVYFRRGRELCTMDTETGIIRAIRSCGETPPEPASLLCGDTVLLCKGAQDFFLSCENGRILRETQFAAAGFPNDRLLCFHNHHEPESTLVFGTEWDSMQELSPISGSTVAGCFSRQQTLLAYRTQPEQDMLILDLYDLNSGLRTASVVLLHILPPEQATEGEDGCLYFLSRDSSRDTPLLLCWDPRQSAAEDSRCYNRPFFTREHPDSAGLSRCGAEAERIGRDYGVQILFQEDRLPQLQGCGIIPEYRVPVITATLEALEPLLSRFPEGMLSGVLTGGAPIRILLADRLENGADSFSYRRGTEGFLLLTAGCDISRSLNRELFRLMDTRIVNTSSTFDQWDGAAPVEERVYIFENAITEGNQAMFQTEEMQEKLRRVCVGIRSAFGLSQSEQDYPWEQYLWNSISYKTTKNRP